jgi:hypothetical protein
MANLNVVSSNYEWNCCHQFAILVEERWLFSFLCVCQFLKSIKRLFMVSPVTLRHRNDFLHVWRSVLANSELDDGVKCINARKMQNFQTSNFKIDLCKNQLTFVCSATVLVWSGTNRRTVAAIHAHVDIGVKSSASSWTIIPMRSLPQKNVRQRSNAALKSVFVDTFLNCSPSTAVYSTFLFIH